MLLSLAKNSGFDKKWKIYNLTIYLPKTRVFAPQTPETDKDANRRCCKTTVCQKQCFCHPVIGNPLTPRSFMSFLFLEAVGNLRIFEVSSFFLETALFRLVEETKQPSRVTGMLGRAQRVTRGTNKKFPPKSCTRIRQFEFFL